MAVLTDRDDSDRRLFLSIKNNFSRDHCGLALRLHEKGLGGIPIVAWDAGPVTMSVDEATGERRHDGAGADAEDRDAAGSEEGSQLARSNA